MADVVSLPLWTNPAFEIDADTYSQYGISLDVEGSLGLGAKIYTGACVASPDGVCRVYPAEIIRNYMREAGYTPWTDDELESYSGSTLFYVLSGYSSTDDAWTPLVAYVPVWDWSYEAQELIVDDELYKEALRQDPIFTLVPYNFVLPIPLFTPSYLYDKNGKYLSNLFYGAAIYTDFILDSPHLEGLWAEIRSMSANGIVGYWFDGSDFTVPSASGVTSYHYTTLDADFWCKYADDWLLYRNNKGGWEWMPFASITQTDTTTKSEFVAPSVYGQNKGDYGHSFARTYVCTTPILSSEQAAKFPSLLRCTKCYFVNLVEQTWKEVAIDSTSLEVKSYDKQRKPVTYSVTFREVVERKYA